MGYSVYGYYPSLAPAIVFAIIFIILTLGAVYQFFKALNTPGTNDEDKKRNRLGLTGLLGGCFEIGAFIARAIGSKKPEDTSPFAAYNVLALIAPTLVEMTNFVCLRELVYVLDMEDKLPFETQKIFKIIILGYRIAALCQALGGGLQSSSKTHVHHGGNGTVIGGVIVQIICMVVYFGVIFLLHTLLIRNPSSIAQSVKHVTYKKRNIRTLLLFLCLSSIFIIIRCVYRLIMVCEGMTGYLATHEVFIYVLDALMVALAMISFFLTESYGIMNKIAFIKRDIEPVQEETVYDYKQGSM